MTDRPLILPGWAVRPHARNIDAMEGANAD